MVANDGSIGDTVDWLLVGVLLPVTQYLVGDLVSVFILLVLFFQIQYLLFWHTTSWLCFLLCLWVINCSWTKTFRWIVQPIRSQYATFDLLNAQRIKIPGPFQAWAADVTPATSLLVVQCWCHLAMAVDSTFIFLYMARSKRIWQIHLLWFVFLFQCWCFITGVDKIG